MTWKEFKKRVDERLKEQGIHEETDIWYIDCGSMLRDDHEESPNVSCDEIGIAISD